jgi:membrane dipeptidase
MTCKMAAVIALTLMITACSTNKHIDAVAVEARPLTAEIPLDTNAKAKMIHANVIVLDTHNDIDVANFIADKNYTMRLPNQVNLPKMIEGGVDVSWFIVYTGQGPLSDAGFDDAYKKAMSKFDAIHRLVTTIAPEKIELALSSDDVRRIHRSGKKVAMIGVENGYPIGTDIKNVEKFYNLGARYMSLAHNGHSQLSDSNTGDKEQDWLHNGLSELGRQVLVEMNRLGIMVDISHPSKTANLEMMKLSKAPVIASHSASRAMNEHSRNLDNEELLALKANGGVVQTVAFRSYINTVKSEKYRAVVTGIYKLAATERGAVWLEWSDVRKLPEEERANYMKGYREIVKVSRDKVDAIDDSIEQVDVSDFVDHIDYIVNLIGIDHVGISSDFDGGGGVKGWNDASETFNVTLELVKRGYSEEAIGKLWGANLLRVLDDVQKVAAELKAG